MDEMPPCPDCGYEGPHTVVEATPEKTVYECGGCYVEFEDPAAEDGEKTL